MLTLLEAKGILASFSNDADNLSEAELSEMWETIEARRRPRQPLGREAIRLGNRTRWMRWAAAASTVVVLAVAGIFWSKTAEVRQTVYQTQAGKTRNIRLPDGSLLILNTHSRVRYASNWQGEAVREVWLEGGAYFHVKHTPTHTPFIVHAADMKVEVLGTAFNVWTKNDHAKVVLNSGKVKLDIGQQAKPVIMKPGEVVEYFATQRKVDHRKVQSRTYTVWMDDKWVLKDISLRELADMMQETFDVQVVIPDTSVAQEKMTGVLPIADIDNLLKGLESIYGLEAEKQADRIILKSVR